MKISVNLATLTNEQMKFFSQLGMFRDERWEGGCDPGEFQEAIDLLKGAGINDLFVEFGG